MIDGSVRPAQMILNFSQYEKGEMNENEWQLKMGEINIEIEKIKEIERSNALRESVEWTDLGSKK